MRSSVQQSLRKNKRKKDLASTKSLASDRRGSNPRSRPWQGRALPTTPLSHKAGDGNRTHVSSLEGWCSTIELHPHMSIIPTLECPVPESNQRHEDFQSSALPTELTGLVMRVSTTRIFYQHISKMSTLFLNFFQTFFTLSIIYNLSSKTHYSLCILHNKKTLKEPSFHDIMILG